MSVNRCYVAWFVFVLNIAGVLIGYSVAYHNQLTSCFNAKFNWSDEANANFNQGVIGSTLVLGMTFGSLMGGKLMMFGR